MSYYEHFANAEITFNERQVRNWTMTEWLRKRVIELNELYVTMSFNNDGKHPWLGRLQRFYGSHLARVQREWPVVFPDFEPPTLEISTEWLKDQRLKIFGQYVEPDAPFGRAEKFSTMCKLKKASFDKDTTRLANVITEQFRQELREYDALLDQVWLPDAVMANEWVREAETICMMLWTARATENLDLAIRAKLRGQYSMLVRDVHRANEEHKLGWEVENWVTDHRIPRVDRYYWTNIAHSEKDPIKPWPLGIEPIFLYEQAMRTTFAGLVETRKAQLSALKLQIHRKHWGQFRGFVSRESSILGNASKGYHMDIPSMKPERIEAILNGAMFTIRPHWSLTPLDQKEGWSRLCETYDEATHQKCNEKGCRCTCHSPYLPGSRHK